MTAEEEKKGDTRSLDGRVYFFAAAFLGVAFLAAAAFLGLTVFATF